MDILPIDVLCLIFKHLSFSTLVRNMTVCKKWYKAFCLYVDSNALFINNHHIEMFCDGTKEEIYDRFPNNYINRYDGYYYKSLKNNNYSVFYKNKILKKEKFRKIQKYKNIKLINSQFNEIWFNKIKLNADKINLSFSKITGTCFYNFKNINYINISSTEIKKGYLQFLSHVSTLIANNVKLNDDDLVNFGQIKCLSLKNNNITNNGLSYLLNVEVLNIKNNAGIDHNCFYYISDISKLTKFTLDLDISNIDDKLIDTINQFVNLKTLYISKPGNYTKNIDFYNINFKYITHIKLCKFNLHINNFNQFTNIINLCLKNTIIVEGAFKNMNNVKTVSLERCQLVNISDILYLKNIKKLSVVNTDINLNDLVNLNNLICLHLEYGYEIYNKKDYTSLINLTKLSNLKVFTFNFYVYRVNEYVTYILDDYINLTLRTRNYKKLHKMY